MCGNVAVLHTADDYSRHFFRSFPSDKMFAVNRFVAAPNGTVSASAQNHSTRGATYELAERPQVAASWQRRLLLAERLLILYSGDTRNSWLTQVAACSSVSRGLVCYHVRRQLCSDVMFQICVCDIMRYFTVFIVCCF